MSSYDAISIYDILIFAFWEQFLISTAMLSIQLNRPSCFLISFFCLFFISSYGRLIDIRGVVDSLYVFFIVLQCLDNWIAQLSPLLFHLLNVSWFSIYLVSFITENIKTRYRTKITRPILNTDVLILSMTKPVELSLSNFLQSIIAGRLTSRAI